MEQPEEKLHLGQLLVGRDAMDFQPAEHLLYLQCPLLRLHGRLDVGLRHRSALHFLSYKRCRMGIDVHGQFGSLFLII